MTKHKAFANRVFFATESIAPETRYEEMGWQGPTGWIAGTNVALRLALGASCGEVPYPRGGGRCDIIVPSKEGGIWLEVKHAWTWKTYTRPAGPNASYLKHLLGDGPSALTDARVKLPSLIGLPDVAAVGLLVVGLDSDHLPFNMADLDRLAQWAGMDRQPWERYDSPRRRSNEPGYDTIGIHCHLWMRTAKTELVKGLIYTAV